MATKRFSAIWFCFSILVGFLPSMVQAHPTESRVSIEKDDDLSVAAGPVSIGFQLVDTKQRKVLTESDLSILHEKKLHCFFFDPALREFRHEHAEFINDEWRVSTSLLVNGEYWLWTQGKVSSDGEEFTASVRVKVMNGKPANPLPPVLGDVRTGVDGLTRVTISESQLFENQAGMLMVEVTHTDGSQPHPGPYLGEVAHVVSVTDDGDSLVHVHPTGVPGETQMMLHVEFARAGEYRLWVQFLDDGQLKTIPLSVVVLPQKVKK
jgi:hypothetical protein